MQTAYSLNRAREGRWTRMRRIVLVNGRLSQHPFVVMAIYALYQTR